MSPAIVKKKVMKKGKAREITLIKLKNPGSVDLKNYNTQIDPLVLSQKKVQHKSGRDIRLGDLKGFNKPVWLEDYGAESSNIKIRTKVNLPAGKATPISLASLKGHTAIIDDIDRYNDDAPPTGTDDDIHKIEITGISAEDQAVATGLTSSPDIWSGPDGILGGRNTGGRRLLLESDETIHILANHLSAGRHQTGWVKVATGGPNNAGPPVLVFNDKLYGIAGANLYEWSGGDKWNIVATHSKTLYAIGIFNNKIYVSGSSGGNGGDLLEWDGYNDLIEKIPMPTEWYDVLVSYLLEFGGELYAGTWGNGQLYKWDGISDSWDLLNGSPWLGQQAYCNGLAELDGKLYAVTTKYLLEWQGSSWTIKSQDVHPVEIRVFNNKIYVGPSYAGSYDGELLEWNEINTLVEVAPWLHGYGYFENSWIETLLEFNGELYGGTGNTGTLLKYNGSNAWDLMASGVWHKSTYVRGLVEYHEKIYGIINGTLYRYDGQSATCDAGSRQCDRVIHYYSEDGGKSWIWEVIDEDVYSQNTEYFHSCMAIDKAGGMHFAWIKYNGTIYYKYRSPDGVLHASEIIEDNVSPNTQLGLSMVVDQQNNVHISWSGLGYGTYTTKYNIQLRSKISSTWQTAESITDVDYNCSLCCMDLDSDGYLHIAFRTDKGNGEIWYVKGRPGDWDAIELVSWDDQVNNWTYLDGLYVEGGVSHILAQCQDGGVPDKLQFFYLRRTSDGWSEPETVTDQAVDKGSGSLAVNADRQAIIIYGRDYPTDTDPEEIFYRRRNFGVNSGDYKVINAETGSEISSTTVTTHKPDIYWTSEAALTEDNEFDCKVPTLITSKWPKVGSEFFNIYQQGFLFAYVHCTEAFASESEASIYLISVNDAVVGNATESQRLRSTAYKTKTRGVICKPKLNKRLIQKGLIS